MSSVAQPVNKKRVRKVTESTISDWLLSPGVVQIVIVIFVILGLLRSWILLPGVLIVGLWLVCFFSQTFRMPLRVPADIGGVDMSRARNRQTH